MENPFLIADDSIYSGAMSRIRPLADAISSSSNAERPKEERLFLAIPLELFNCSVRKGLITRLINRYASVLVVHRPVDDIEFEVVDCELPMSDFAMIARVLASSWKICFVSEKNRGDVEIVHSDGRRLPIPSLQLPLNFQEFCEVEKRWRAFGMAAELHLYVVGGESDDTTLAMQCEFGFGDADSINIKKGPPNKSFQRRIKRLVESDRNICVGTHRISHAHTENVGLRIAPTKRELRALIFNMLMERVDLSHGQYGAPSRTPQR